MTKLPDKLKKKRDELALRFQDEHFCIFCRDCAQCGFEAGHAEMMRLVQPLIEALEFYSWSSPRQFPEGYYETHIAKGEGGHVKFGHKARLALEQFKKEIEP